MACAREHDLLRGSSGQQHLQALKVVVVIADKPRPVGSDNGAAVVAFRGDIRVHIVRTVENHIHHDMAGFVDGGTPLQCFRTIVLGNHCLEEVGGGERPFLVAGISARVLDDALDIGAGAPKVNSQTSSRLAPARSDPSPTRNIFSRSARPGSGIWMMRLRRPARINAGSQRVMSFDAARKINPGCA